MLKKICKYIICPTLFSALLLYSSVASPDTGFDGKTIRNPYTYAADRMILGNNRISPYYSDNEKVFDGVSVAGTATVYSDWYEVGTMEFIAVELAAVAGTGDTDVSFGFRTSNDPKNHACLPVTIKATMGDTAATAWEAITIPVEATSHIQYWSTGVGTNGTSLVYVIQTTRN